MKLNLHVMVTTVSLLFLATSRAAESAADGDWEHSLVQIDVTRKQYDYMQPWSKRTRSVQKTGLMIGPQEILTTAEEMSDRTLVRVQKGGRGRWWNGEVAWIDYHANLALVTAKDEALWKDLRPAELSAGSPGRENLQLVRWRNGNLEQRKAEFNQFLVDDSRLSFVSHLQMEISSEMNAVGWAEPVVSGKKVVGIACSQGGTTGRIIPTSFIVPILQARKAGTYRGLGYFPFVWQPSENPDVHAYLKWKGEPRGVLVVDVPDSSPTNGALKPKDIILKVDGFDIDIQGYYQDPDYGHLSLENLSTRKKFAGDTLKIKLWSDGAEKEINYRIPKAEYSVKLLPDNLFDQEPEYVIAGGLVFEPLTIPYLRSFGADWRRSAPPRLSYYNNDSPTKERPTLVLLSMVLPDRFNLGYQDSRYLVVDQVNGQKIGRLTDLQAALQKPVNGFHVIEFAKSENLRRMVLDADELPEATRRVLDRYGITKDHYFAPGDKAEAAGTGSR